MAMKTTLFCITIAIMLFWGCSPSQEPITVNQLLTNRSSKIWINYSKKTDGVEQLIACQKDNEWIFYMNGRIDEKTGLVRCQIDEKDRLGNYSFFLAGSNNDILYLKYKDVSSNFYTVKCNIAKLTETELIFRYQVVRLDGASVSIEELSFKTPEF
jgi:hypothetical protein